MTTIVFKDDLVTRREAIRRVSALLGGAALIGQTAWLAGCDGRAYARRGTWFLPYEVDAARRDRGHDPAGDEDARRQGRRRRVFIATMVTDTYDPSEQRLFREGLETLERESQAQNGAGFMASSPQQRVALLERLDREAIAYMREPGRDRPAALLSNVERADAARLLHVRDRLHAGVALMATTLPAESTQHARHSAQKAMTFDHVERIGGLSRIVDRDIEILKMNLVQLHDGRYEARSSAWERLESAWETVRSELADDSASSPLTGDVSPGNGAAAAAAEVDAPMAVVSTVPLAARSLNWVTEVLGPAISSTARQVVRWSREPARRAELRAAALRVRGFVSGAALAGAKHASNGWCGLQGVVRRQASPWRARGHVSTANGRHGGRQTSVCRDRIFGWRDRSSLAICATVPQRRSCRPPSRAVDAHRGNGSTNLAQGNSGGSHATARKGARRRAWKARRRR